MTLDLIVKNLVAATKVDLKTTIRVATKALIVLTVATELLKAVVAALVGAQ